MSEDVGPPVSTAYESQRPSLSHNTSINTRDFTISNQLGGGKEDVPVQKSKQKIVMAKNGKYLRFESQYDNQNRSKIAKTAANGVRNTLNKRKTFVLGSYQFDNTKPEYNNEYSIYHDPAPQKSKVSDRHRMSVIEEPSNSSFNIMQQQSVSKMQESSSLFRRPRESLHGTSVHSLRASSLEASPDAI